MRLLSLSCSLILLVAGTAGAQPGAAPRLVRYPAEALLQTRQRAAAGDPALQPALDGLRAAADAALAAGPFSVTDKPAPPPGGDRHDYRSLAPYWWPDPAAADGLPYVRRDGRVNPEARGRASDAPRLRRMADAVFTLALAHYLTGHAPYARHAARLLRAWFLDPDTRMNPHLRYGQAIPGAAEGRNYGIIETRCLVDVVDAAALLAGAPGWTARDEGGLRQWFARYLDWLLVSPLGREEAARPNNHGTWYDVQVVAFARYVGRDDLARRVLSEARTRRLGRHLAPDGRQPEELARTNGLSYSVFNLLALCELAHAGEALGVDLWHARPGGTASLQDALDFLLPYLNQTRLWPYAQIAPPDWRMAALVLRRAARAYGGDPYEAALRCLPGAAALAADAFQLLLPPP